MALDWGIGRYEDTAAALEPIATIVVGRSGVRPGDRALDLGCGTGNAAIALARSGADVIAVDPSPRLLGVTKARAADAGLMVDARPGEGAGIPIDDGAVDLVVSVFAVIFSPEPAASMAEMKRVLAPGGRITLTAWVPGFGMGRAYAAVGAAMAAATGTPPPPSPFAWHDPAALSALARPHGLRVATEELSISFEAASPEAQLELDAGTHPTWIDYLAKLRQAGISEDVVREPALAALREVNEDPAAFRTTSRYVIATLR